MAGFSGRGVRSQKVSDAFGPGVLRGDSFRLLLAGSVLRVQRRDTLQVERGERAHRI